MAERIMHLSIANLFDGNHNHHGIPGFISEFSGNLYSGDGKRPMMLDRFGIGPEFPVRLLVGIPQKTMTREQRLIAEAFCQSVFGYANTDSKKLWQYGKGWRPVNPNRQPGSIHDSRLDIDFMLSLGISKAVWCNDILIAPNAFDQSASTKPSTLMRYFFSLVAFGFSDPHQFFTLASQRQ